jgi:SAM-dependent methyltransferase
MQHCVNCNATLTWSGQYTCCGACGLWRSSLEPAVLSPEAWAQVDESMRGAGLKDLRQSNFAHLLTRLKQVQNGLKGRLLDVGCAHGWFLQQAKQHGFDATGIEPDPRIAQLALQAGCTVKIGFFPEILTSADEFDVISFNDVFEHLPDPKRCLQACSKHLRVDGLLVINLPNSRGAFFRLARVLKWFGLSGPWMRLWQVGFASPHLFYFDSVNLKQLVEPAGFKRCHLSTLDTLKVTGLWQRLRMDTHTHVFMHALQWCVIAALAPLFRLLPSDISLQMYRKTQS